jgi:hypothetical protein
LKQQINRHATLQSRQLRRDMGQTAGLGGQLEYVDQAIEVAQDRRHGFDGVRGWIDADDRVAAAEQEAVDGAE